MKSKEELLKIYSAYLPYEINFRFCHAWSETIMKLHSVCFEKEVVNDNVYLQPKNIEPILYSMDMLTKEIEHKGERFIPIEKIQEIFELPEDKCFLLRDVVSSLSDFFFTKDLTDIFRFNTVVDIYNKLLEWHFNVFGLDESEYIKKEKL